MRLATHTVQPSQGGLARRPAHQRGVGMELLEMAADGQDLLGQEDAHTARMHRGGAVVKQRGGISW